MVAILPQKPTQAAHPRPRGAAPKGLDGQALEWDPEEGSWRRASLLAPRAPGRARGPAASESASAIVLPAVESLQPLRRDGRD